MSGNKPVLYIYFFMLVISVSAYAAPAGSYVEVNGDLQVSGSGAVHFPAGSKQTTAACRYEDNGDGTVTDCRSGLIWLKDANCPGVTMTWDNAVAWAAALASGTCGLTDGSIAGDWRLPTRLEWRAMVAQAKRSLYSNPALTDAAGTAQWTAGNLFLNVQLGDPVNPGSYWSSTDYASDTTRAWYVNIVNGAMDGFFKWYLFSVWPVRSGQ